VAVGLTIVLVAILVLVFAGVFDGAKTSPQHRHARACHPHAHHDCHRRLRR
jgi:cell division septation protein DedD